MQRPQRDATCGRCGAVPGHETWYASDAPAGPNSVVFEDDGDTGYFYAVERRGKDLKIWDAVQIYAVRNVVDREIRYELEIVWTQGGQQAALYLNGYPHAVFDFDARQGYCRTGFPPPPQTGWSSQGHAWDDKALEPFRQPDA